MKRFIAACIITYIVIVGLFYWKQRDLMYPPEAHTFKSEIADSPDMQWVEITTEDGLTLKSWYKKADDTKPTFLAFHGNGGTIWHLIPQARVITGEGYGLLLAEYRHYGGNAGTPNEEGFYKDAEAHFEWLKQNNVEDIIIYGQSLGSGPAVRLATQEEAKALILEVPFSSALDVAAYKFPFLPFPSIIMHDQYDNIGKISEVDEPILMGLAAKDNQVPVHLGQMLFKKANEPKTLKTYENANHEDLYKYGFGNEVITFVQNQEDAE